MDDTAAETPWPRWAAGAAALGLGSAMSAPVVVGDTALGALKVYGDRAHALGPDAEQVDAEQVDAEQVLVMSAGLAGVLMLQLRRLAGAAVRSDHLRRAVDGRDSVNLATGVVMASERLSRRDALDLLVARARDEGRPLEEVARRVLHQAGARTSPPRRSA